MIKLIKKILKGVLALVVVGVLVLAIVLSYESDCAAPSAVAKGRDLMKAAVYRCYGSPDVISVESVEKPVQGDNEVLVKIKAASVNPLDWHYMRGSPYIMRMGSGIGAPNDFRMGVDFAGIVESVGKNVTKFSVGDEVFGGGNGAFAEYIVVAENRSITQKPANVTFEQAAAIPIAAISALQALRDKGKLASGEKVLINGASGGVGTFAVQIAKSMGAEVTGVCSGRNEDMVRSLGADTVIDYEKDSYIDSGQQYDVIVDMVGNHPLLANREVLTADGSFVIVGGPKGNWLGPLVSPIKALAISPFVEQEFVMLLAQMGGDDLMILADLMRSGELAPVIDRTFSLDELSDAVRYSEEGHARGKIIIDIDL